MRAAANRRDRAGVGAASGRRTEVGVLGGRAGARLPGELLPKRGERGREEHLEEEKVRRKFC